MPVPGVNGTMMRIGCDCVLRLCGHADAGQAGQQGAGKKGFHG
jgi:hypothetical protein